MSIPPLGLALMACLNMATWASQDVTLHVMKVWLSEKVSAGLEVLRGLYLPVGAGDLLEVLYGFPAGLFVQVSHDDRCSFKYIER